MKHDAERAALRGCFEAALCAVQPAQVLQSYLQVDAWGLRFERGAARAALPWPDRAAGGRLRLLAIGKAAARFAAAFEARVSQIDAGWSWSKRGTSKHSPPRVSSKLRTRFPMSRVSPREMPCLRSPRILDRSIGT